jgi:hypothetical protein
MQVFCRLRQLHMRPRRKPTRSVLCCDVMCCTAYYTDTIKFRNQFKVRGSTNMWKCELLLTIQQCSVLQGPHQEV